MWLARSLPGVALAVGLAACGGGGGSDVDARIDDLFGDAAFGTLDRNMARRILETAPADDGAPRIARRAPARAVGVAARSQE